MKQHFYPWLIGLTILLLSLEVLSFIIIFQWLGIWVILLWVGLMAFIGISLLYQQYVQLEDLRGDLKLAFRENERAGLETLLQSLIFPFLGAWLFIIPGIVTDVLGLCCLIPTLTRPLARWIAGNKSRLSRTFTS